LASVATILAEPSHLVAQTAPTVPPTPSLDGTWEGKMNDIWLLKLYAELAVGTEFRAVVTFVMLKFKCKNVFFRVWEQ
jgi:hypothetical protein